MIFQFIYLYDCWLWILNVVTLKDKIEENYIFLLFDALKLWKGKKGVQTTIRVIYGDGADTKCNQSYFYLRFLAQRDEKLIVYNNVEWKPIVENTTSHS